MLAKAYGAVDNSAKKISNRKMTSIPLQNGANTDGKILQILKKPHKHLTSKSLLTWSEEIFLSPHANNDFVTGPGNLFMN